MGNRTNGHKLDEAQDVVEQTAQPRILQPGEVALPQRFVAHMQNKIGAQEVRILYLESYVESLEQQLQSTVEELDEV